jgi:cyclopropane-fatty-acyl-phospholipid synthase
MSLALSTSRNTTGALGFMDGWARRYIAKQLSNLRRGEIQLQEEGGALMLGERADLRATIRIHRSRFFRQAVLGGTLSVAESYLRGDWDCDDLTSLLRICVRNGGAAYRLDGGLARFARIGHRIFHWLRANTRAGSRNNIRAHYDLGNEFYRLWLDETMAYSSGIFPSAQSTMQEASEEKFDRVCRKLQLEPSDNLLEIGTGWGGFAIHAAKHHGCHVTTTTISQEQYSVADQRIQAEGLSRQIRLLKEDYRDLEGQFDKLVSIEMIEAVGHRFLDQYFERCGKLLKPDGSFVLQAIVIPERDHAAYLKSVDFIRRYVFPGGCLPSVASIQQSMGRTTDMRLVHMEDIAPHYAQTLRHWRRKFQDCIEDVRAMGHSEEFIRLWNYYLCYCEAGFEERYVGVVQMQFDKPECRRDPAELNALAAATRHGRTQPDHETSAAQSAVSRPSREPACCGVSS